MLALTEAARHVGVDIDLSEDVVTAPDQHDQFRLGEQIAGQIIPDRAHVGDVLVALLRDRRPTYATADGNPRMLGFAAGLGLEHELGAVEHVGVDRGVGRAPRPNALAGHLQQRVTPLVVEMCRAQRAYDLRGFRRGAARHGRFPRTVVARRSTPSRRLTMTTVSPAWWLRSASVMSYKLPMCLSPIAVITSPACNPACSTGLPARTPVMRTPSDTPPPLMSGIVPR